MSRANVDSEFESRVNKTFQTKDKRISSNDLNLIHYITSLYGNALSAKGLNLIDPIYANMFYYNKHTDTTKIDLKAGTTEATSGSGLTLQVGDTAEKFNKVVVEVGDMSSSALGIKGVDISTQEGAAKSIAKIKEAINVI